MVIETVINWTINLNDVHQTDCIYLKEAQFHQKRGTFKVYGDFASNVQHQLEILASLDAIVYVCDVENYRCCMPVHMFKKSLAFVKG